MVVREQGAGMLATVAVPADQADRYVQSLSAKIDAYAASGAGRHRALVARLEDAFTETLRSVYTDDDTTFPEGPEAVWWEVWTTPAALHTLETVATRLQITLGEDRVRFPDRVVLLTRATPAALDQLFVNSSAVVELRLAHDTPEAFVELSNADQVEWADEFLGRTVYKPGEAEVSVLILDGGVTRTHRLLEPFLRKSDWQAYKPHWTPGENSTVGHRGHGTGMAGLALYGDLTPLLLGSAAITDGRSR